jgi:ferredoxin
MSDVLIKFESEKKEGIVAVGTYLLDAAKRLGVSVECDCNNEEIEEPTFSCAMKISKGKTLLSKQTKVEMEQLSSQARRSGERLACQAKIEKPGEVTVMSVKKKETTEEETKAAEDKRTEEFREEFKELPLEKKIANLVELEAIALSETFSFVMNSPYAAVEKVMDVLAEFGLKMEEEDKHAKRPDEHVEKKEEKETPDEKKSTEKKSPTTAKKKPASKRTASKKTTTRKTTRKRTSRKTAAQKTEEPDTGEE